MAVCFHLYKLGGFADLPPMRRRRSRTTSTTGLRSNSETNEVCYIKRTLPSHTGRCDISGDACTHAIPEVSRYNIRPSPPPPRQPMRTKAVGLSGPSKAVSLARHVLQMFGVDQHPELGD